MTSAKTISIFTAFVVAAGFSGFGFPSKIAVAWDVPPVGPSGPVGGDSSGGGESSGGEGAIQRWFRERKERYERERQEERRSEHEYHETVERWSRMALENEEQYRIQQERDSKIQRENLLKARQKAEIMHAWNDIGIEAYRAGDLGNAITYFKAAKRYAPESADIQHNLQRAEGKLSSKAENYLSSVGTTLGIVDLWPHLLIFHPDPNIRAEANRELAREAVQTIAESAAAFVAEERLSGGKIEPFPWETQAERMARRQEAIRHAQKIESLRMEALKEARELAEPVLVSDMKEDMRIQTKPATKQLLKICISGFQ